MPLLEGIQEADFYQLTDGMDTISSAVILGKSKWRDVQNVNYFPIGGFCWRQGYTTLNSSAVSSSSCTGLYMARFSTATNTAFLVNGAAIYSMANLGGTWVDRTNGTTITGANNNLWSFAMLNDTVVLGNGVDTCLQVTSGLVTTTLAGSPAFTSALFPVEFRGYMFYFNTVEGAVAYPDRGRFSDANAPNLFTLLGSNNYVDVATKQGGDVRGAVSYNGRLFVFKRHGIWAIDFQPTQVNSSGVTFPFTQNPLPVVEGVGTQSHRSIVKFTTPVTHQAPGLELVFFVDQFGIPRIFDGRTTVQAGYNISKSRDTGIMSLSDMDKTRIGQVFAVNYPERSQIFCFMTKTNSQNDTCWVLDYSTKFVWCRMSFADTFNVGALFEKTDGTFRLFFGDYAGKVYEYDTTQLDNGVAISSYAVTGDIFNQSPTINSNFENIELRGSTGSTTQTISLAYYVDGDDSVSITDSVALAKTQDQWDDQSWDDMQWGASGLVTKTRQINQDAKTLRVKFYNTTASNTATVEGFSLFSRPLGWKQS